ncbi:hypothetical protein Tco_1534009 [Tanacetum coccineum]
MELLKSEYDLKTRGVILFGHDARPRQAGKPRPAKKSKSDATASTDGSSASTQFRELMEQELRLKREAAERAFEAQAEKDSTLMQLEELRFLATSTKDLDDDDAYWIKKQKRLIKNKMRNDLGDEDDEDEYAAIIDMSTPMQPLTRPITPGLVLMNPHSKILPLKGLGLPIAHHAVDELIEFSGETKVLNSMEGSGYSQVVARRAIDEITEFSGETETLKYMKVSAMIAEMEAMNDPNEYFDSLICLRDSRRMGNDKLLLLNESIVGVEEEISTLEAHLEIMDAAINSE